MSRLLVFVVLILVLYYLLRHLFKDMASGRKNVRAESDPEELVLDPCCQTYIPKGSALKSRISGKDVYFCSQECAKKFLQKK